MGAFLTVYSHRYCSMDLYPMDNAAPAYRYFSKFRQNKFYFCCHFSVFEQIRYLIGEFGQLSNCDCRISSIRDSRFVQRNVGWMQLRLYSMLRGVRTTKRTKVQRNTSDDFNRQSSIAVSGSIRTVSLNKCLYLNRHRRLAIDWKPFWSTDDVSRPLAHSHA